MSLLKQIDDKGAVLEWSPVNSYPNLVALGTKDSSGVGFDDYGGELEIHKLDLNARSQATVLLGKARANSRFASIAWSQMTLAKDRYPYGLIAGGMNDGFVHIWDPSKIANNTDPDSDPLVVSIEQHQGAVRGLQFNPHKDSSHLLASGGNDGEVYVMSLEHPDTPDVFVPAPPPNNAKHSAPVTKVAWNSQVAYILASAAQNGSCYVWDLRQKKAWCELRDPTGAAISDVAWNPDQGLNIITASGDDKNPVLKLWDLRSSTTLPLATLQGHTEGILSVAWCPTDPSLVLSCGKDNQTILWDLFLLQPVYNLMSSNPTAMNQSNMTKDANDQSVFSGLASSAGQRRYHVSWSPCLPAVIGACSFDRSLQFYSLSGVRSKFNRAPKWLRRPVGASFGFGGKLAVFDNGASAGSSGPSGSGSAMIKVCQVIEDPELVSSADKFNKSVSSGDFKSFCEMKSESSVTSHERDVWSLMKVIWFENSAREELLKFLGFSADTIEEAVEKYVSSKAAGIPSPPRSPIRRPLQLHQQSYSSLLSMSFDAHSPTQQSKVSAEELFSLNAEGVIANAQSILETDDILAVNTTTKSDESKAASSKKITPSDAEPVIAKAIVAGNFAGAVDCCLSAGLLAEALLLAQCGDQALWLSTQEAFFNLQKAKRPFLSILHAIIKQDLRNFILMSDLSTWRETMAILSTYAKTEEFPILCETLAHRLESELQDIQSACLCYMCATNVPRVLGFWVDELKTANQTLGILDTNALQAFVEKVVVFTQANPTQDLGQETSQFFVEYASILAGQGRLDIASYFLKGSMQGESALADRLYHAGLKPVGSRPPLFPFSRVNVPVYSAGNPAAMNQQAAGANRSTTNKNPAAQSNAAQPARPGVTPTPQQPAALPQGWLELVDPASGRTYYVNQATGKSQWERPPPDPTPQVRPAPAQPGVMPGMQQTAYSNIATQQPGGYKHPVSPSANQPVGHQPMPQAVPQAVSQGMPQAHPQAFPQSIPQAVPHGMTQNPGPQVIPPATPQVAPAAIPGAYGGTVMQSASATPASHLSMVSPQPYGMSSPAGKAAPVGASSPSPAPAASPAPAPTPVKQVAPAIHSEAIQVLGAIIEQVAGSNLSPMERKQMAAINQSYSHLLEKAATGDISSDVLQKIEQMVHELSTRNYAMANAIQTDLANSVWAQHKEWLKGVKILIQLASKH